MDLGKVNWKPFGKNSLLSELRGVRDCSGGSNCRQVETAELGWEDGMRWEWGAWGRGCMATISWWNFNGWGVASDAWAEKVVSWDGIYSWGRCPENSWNDDRGFRILHKLGRLGGSVSLASNFSSGHDLTVHEFEPCIGLAAVSTEPASDPLSPFSLPHPRSRCLSHTNK